jgi:hypothetical protein
LEEKIRKAEVGGEGSKRSRRRRKIRKRSARFDEEDSSPLVVLHRKWKTQSVQQDWRRRRRGVGRRRKSECLREGR